MHVMPQARHGDTVTWHPVTLGHLVRYVNEAALRLTQCNCEIETLGRMTALVGRIDDRRFRNRDSED